MKKGDVRSMLCPECGGDNYVTDTRPYDKEENVIKRRRVCKLCGHRFTTLERIVEENSDDQD